MHRLTEAKRINVVGTSGAGKSVFSRRLAEALGLPHVEMDRLFWKPEWRQSSDGEFTEALDGAISGDAWVLDGNYGRTQPLKWARTDCVVWLDYSLPVTLLRALRRAVVRSWTGHELWPGTGNRESFSRLFSRDSILLWTLRSHGRNRRRYLEIQEDPSRKFAMLRISSPVEAERILAGLAGPGRLV